MCCVGRKKVTGKVTIKTHKQIKKKENKTSKTKTKQKKTLGE
jgi:hypothetical protein